MAVAAEPAVTSGSGISAGRGEAAHDSLRDDLIDYGLIRKDQVQTIIKLVPIITVASCINSALFALVAWRYYPGTALFLWAASIWLISGVLFSIWLRMRHCTRVSPSRRTMNHMSIGAVVFGIPWALLPALMFPTAPMSIQIFIVALITGVACTGAFILSPVPRAAILFAATLLTPIVFQNIMTAQPHYVALAALTLIYGATLTASILNQWRIATARAIDSQAVTHQNEFIALLLHDFETSASDWLWECDANFRLSYCSERLPELVGRDRGSLLGTPFAALANGEENSPGWKKALSLMEQKQEFHDAKVLSRVKGKHCWWSLTARPIFADGGKFLGYRGVGSDITAVYAADELMRAKEHAEKAHESKARFLAMMSHELKTPLNAIIGFSDLIAGQKLGEIDDERYVEYARDINENSRHLLAIINDVLQMARAENGTVRLDEETFSVQHLIETITRLLNPSASEAGVTILPPDELPDVKINGDYGLIKQVLVNLITNAIKFTPAGGEIEIGYGNDRQTGLIIFVKDTGIGVSGDDLERIFEPFKQLDDQLGRRTTGLGLGLSIAREFARAHGGDIEFKSQPGKGSTVSLSIPAWRVKQLTDAA